MPGPGISDVIDVSLIPAPVIKDVVDASLTPGRGVTDVNNASLMSGPAHLHYAIAFSSDSTCPKNVSRCGVYTSVRTLAGNHPSIYLMNHYQKNLPRLLVHFDSPFGRILLAVTAPPGNRWRTSKIFSRGKRPSRRRDDGKSAH